MRNAHLTRFGGPGLTAARPVAPPEPCLECATGKPCKPTGPCDPLMYAMGVYFKRKHEREQETMRNLIASLRSKPSEPPASP